MLPATRYHSTLILSGLLCLAQHTHAQTPCVTELDVTDPFTKVRVLAVSDGRGGTAGPGHASGPAFRWRAEDKNLSLELRWTLPMNGPLTVLERDPLLLLLENDSVLTLYSLRTELATHEADANGTARVKGSFAYRITPTEAKLLSTYWVNRIRLYHSGGFHEYVAEKDPIWQQGLERLTTCFLQTCSSGQVPLNTVVSQKAGGPSPIH